MGEKKIFAESVTLYDLKSVFDSVCSKRKLAQSVSAFKEDLSSDENLLNEFAKYNTLDFLTFLG